MDAGFLRRQAATALRLASQCSDGEMAVRLKLVAAELLQRVGGLEADQHVDAPPVHVIAQSNKSDGTADQA